MIDGMIGYEETLISISLESSIHFDTLFNEGILSTMFFLKLIKIESIINVWEKYSGT